MPAAGATTTRRRAALALIGLLVVVAAVAVVTALSGAGSRPSRPAWAFGPFAGYVWEGPVSSLSASWTVPRIIGRSRGFAATWVGAQTPSSSGAFIQIGTDEEHQPLRREPSEGAEYTAFWSDSAHDFHPQFLLHVRAGDEVSASLELAHGRWTLAIVDRSSGVGARVATRAETHARFSVAEWVQEDVTGEKTGQPVSYPRLTAVEFRHLALDSVAPPYARLYSEWMSAGASLLAPSPLHGDAFSLHPASVGAAGARFLQIGARVDAATRMLVAASNGWSGATQYSQLAATSARFIAVLDQQARALAGTRWPARARAPMQSLIRSLEALGGLARPPAVVSPTGLSAWRSALDAGVVAVVGDEHLVRRALQVPELLVGN